MKPLFIFLFALSLTAQAEVLPHGKVMCEGADCLEPRDAREAGESRSSNPPVKPSPLPVRKAKAVAKVQRPDSVSRDSNLPTYFEGADLVGPSPRSSAEVAFTPKSHDPKLAGLKVGDILSAVIEQEITASPEMPTPIRAIAISGAFKGSTFVGEAVLEKELKRVCLNFSHLRLTNGGESFGLKAQGLAPRGSVCLEGEYHSQTGIFFLAEMASAGAAGFLDSTINRNQTALGTYQQEPSLSNSGKAAGVTALSKTTDRMADGVRQTPGYTQLPGYQEIQIMIVEDPVENGS